MRSFISHIFTVSDVMNCHPLPRPVIKQISNNGSNNDSKYDGVEERALLATGLQTILIAWSAIVQQDR